MYMSKLSSALVQNLFLDVFFALFVEVILELFDFSMMFDPCQNFNTISRNCNTLQKSHRRGFAHDKVSSITVSDGQVTRQTGTSFPAQVPRSWGVGITPQAGGRRDGAGGHLINRPAGAWIQQVSVAPAVLHE